MQEGKAGKRLCCICRCLLCATGHLKRCMQSLAMRGSCTVKYETSPLCAGLTNSMATLATSDLCLPVTSPDIGVECPSLCNRLLANFGVVRSNLCNRSIANFGVVCSSLCNRSIAACCHATCCVEFHSQETAQRAACDVNTPGRRSCGGA